MFIWSPNYSDRREFTRKHLKDLMNYTTDLGHLSLSY